MGLNLRSYLSSPGMPFVPSPATHTSPSSPLEVSAGWSKCGIMNRKNTSSAGSLRRGLEFRVWPTTLKVFSSYPPVLGSKPKTDPNGSAFSCNSSRKVTLTHSPHQARWDAWSPWMLQNSVPPGLIPWCHVFQFTPPSQDLVCPVRCYLLGTSDKAQHRVDIS